MQPVQATMAQFQPLQLNQTGQLNSQPLQQAQQALIQQQNTCQYQLEQCDIKPQFSLIPTVSQPPSNVNVSQGGINNISTIPTVLENGANVASFFRNPCKRAESFVIDEVKLMLKEIEARKHILLSISPSTNRLKRRAWEEVAICMANRWPHAPRRTADQVKKKWENLVSKTKRKVRAGHVTPDLDWNETNAAVMQFLTQHSPPVRLRYSTSATPSLLNLGNVSVSSISSPNCTNVNTFNTSYSTVSNTFLEPYSNANTVFSSGTTQTSNTIFKSQFTDLNGCDLNKQSVLNNSKLNPNQSFNSHELTEIGIITNKQTEHSTDTDRTNTITVGDTSGHDTSTSVGQNTLNSNGIFNATGTINDQFLSNFPFNTSLVNFGLSTNTNLPESINLFGYELQKKMFEQFKLEHELRMDILRLQKQAWILQLNLFKTNNHDNNNHHNINDNNTNNNNNNQQLNSQTLLLNKDSNLSEFDEKSSDIKNSILDENHLNSPMFPLIEHSNEMNDCHMNTDIIDEHLPKSQTQQSQLSSSTSSSSSSITSSSLTTIDTHSQQQQLQQNKSENQNQNGD